MVSVLWMWGNKASTSEGRGLSRGEAKGDGIMESEGTAETTVDTTGLFSEREATREAKVALKTSLVAPTFPNT